MYTVHWISTVCKVCSLIHELSCKLYKSRSKTLLTWNSRLCWPLSGSRCFVTLYPGLPIFTKRLMSTRGFSGAGCAGASLASLAALCALYQPCRTHSQIIWHNTSVPCQYIDKLIAYIKFIIEHFHKVCSSLSTTSSYTNYISFLPTVDTLAKKWHLTWPIKMLKTSC